MLILITTVSTCRMYWLELWPSVLWLLVLVDPPWVDGIWRTQKQTLPTRTTPTSSNQPSLSPFSSCQQAHHVIIWNLYSIYVYIYCLFSHCITFPHIHVHFMYYGSRNLSLQFHPHALKFTLPCDVSGVKKYPIKYVLMYIVSRCD